MKRDLRQGMQNGNSSPCLKEEEGYPIQHQVFMSEKTFSESGDTILANKEEVTTIGWLKKRIQFS